MSLVTESTQPPPRPSPDPHALSSLSDADLLDAWSRDRHAAALAALVERYSVMVLSVCRRRCRCEADAEDAFQTTFLYLARNSNKIRHPDRLAGWLHRVAQRSAVATLKPANRESVPMVEPPAEPDDPFDRLTQRHEAIVLDEELSDLPEHKRVTHLSTPPAKGIYPIRPSIHLFSNLFLLREYV
jgi:RNA polymerase sigma factor (sigma-70 family)